MYSQDWCSYAWDAQSFRWKSVASPYQGISIDGFPPELRRAHQNDDRAVMEAYGFDWRTMTEIENAVELFKSTGVLTA